MIIGVFFVVVVKMHLLIKCAVEVLDEVEIKVLVLILSPNNYFQGLSHFFGLVSNKRIRNKMFGTTRWGFKHLRKHCEP